MPNILIYEHLCALEPHLAADDPLRALLPEGRAMLDAVTADFRAVPGVNLLPFNTPHPSKPSVSSTSPTRGEVSATCSTYEATDLNSPIPHLPLDGGGRLEQRDKRVGVLEVLADILPSCDAVLLIAPESDGTLANLADMVVSAGVRLLGPTPEAIRLCTDKFALALHWLRHGVPTPPTTLADVEPTTYPVVVKPRDGAGSCDTVLCWNSEQYLAAVMPNSIVQPYHGGLAASVAFINGVPLPPCQQIQSDDGRFQYLGGECPLPPDLAERATRIASQAVACVPGLMGYYGVDVVLGEMDVAIEINPRLTTSYVGLRTIILTNLAGLMLGLEVPYKTVRKQAVSFSATDKT